MEICDIPNQYVYDVIENSDAFEEDKQEFKSMLADMERKNDKSLVNRQLNKVKSHQDSAELIWYKSAHKAREIMLAMVERMGGCEKVAAILFADSGRVETWDNEFWAGEEFEADEIVAGGKHEAR
jgi:hypothetical protein